MFGATVRIKVRRLPQYGAMASFIGVVVKTAVYGSECAWHNASAEKKNMG